MLSMLLGLIFFLLLLQIVFDFIPLDRRIVGVIMLLVVLMFFFGRGPGWHW